jgi:hypothetical protein
VYRRHAPHHPARAAGQHRRARPRQWNFKSYRHQNSVVLHGFLIELFIHARKVADDLVRETPESGDLGFPLRDILRQAVHTIFGSDFLNPNSAQIFVASFSNSEDDLSQ